MEKQENNFLQTDFFLSATTPLGFKSYFETIRQERIKLQILLKGAPGSGKAELLASLKGADMGEVECIHSLQEPMRLVGVILQPKVQAEYERIAENENRKKGIAVLDASTPNCLEPIAPGLSEQIIDLYSVVDSAMLQSQVQAVQIETLLARIDCLQMRAARYIASVGGLLYDSRRAVACATDFSKIERYVAHLCARELPPLHKIGNEKRRLLSAITPDGNLCYTNTVEALAKRIFVFHDEYGAASKVLFELLHTEALARGYDVICCPCALFPDEKIEHIFIPSLGLAFLTSNTWHPFSFVQAQNIHCERFTDKKALKNCRTRLRFNTKAAKDLQSQCIVLLAQVRDCQKELRALYRLAVDRGALEEKANDLAELCKET